jgi:hypothetical protein
LQGDHCYVVAPGSYVVTSNYRGYYIGNAGPTAREQLPVVPAGVLGGSVDTEELDIPAPDGDDSRPVEDAGWVVTTLREGCAPGTRIDTLVRLSGAFCRAGQSPAFACAVLVPWVLSQPGTHVTHAEAERTIRSIYERDSKRPAYVVDEFDDKGGKFPEVQDFSAFHAQYHTQTTEWIVNEWLPAGSIVFVVSPPGRYKTWLTFDLAYSMATGLPFLGRFAVQRPGTVLLVQQEDNYGDIARRMDRIRLARKSEQGAQSFEGVPLHIWPTRSFTATTPGLRALETEIRRHRPGLVILDPLYSLTSAEDFMANAAKALMPLKKLRDVYGTSFLIVAHAKKGAQELGREGLWGSQFLNAFQEGGWQIRDVKDGTEEQVHVARYFKSSHTPLPLQLEFMIGEDSGYRVSVQDVLEEVDPSTDPFIVALTGSPGLTGKQLQEILELSYSSVMRRLGRLEQEGKIRRERGKAKTGEPDRWFANEDPLQDV